MHHTMHVLDNPAVSQGKYIDTATLTTYFIDTYEAGRFDKEATNYISTARLKG